MFPMNCPSCGRKGRVANHLLRKPLSCVKCGAPFWLDHEGTVHAGSPAVEPGREADRPSSSRSADVDLDLGKLFRTSKRFRALASAAAAVLLVGVVALLVAPKRPAGDLKAQARYLGELFVDNKVGRIRAMAVPETADDALAWHGLMRQRLNYQGARRRPRDVRSDVVVLSDDGTRGVTLLSLFVPGAVEPASAGDDGPKNKLTLQLSWTKVRGRWMLDGSMTLQAALSATPNAAAVAGRSERGPRPGGTR